MKKIISSIVAAALLCSFTFLPGDCSTLLFFKEGTATTMTSYNDDGKVTGSTKTTYTKVSKIPGGLSANANQENYDKKGKLSNKSEYVLKCEKGALLIDMKMMLPQQQAEAYKDMEVTVDGNNLEFPSDLNVGSTLKDADIKFTFKTKEGAVLPMSNLAIRIYNRKVEAKETITTPAGTFECFKITESAETKTMFTIKVKTTSWFSFEAGTVKTESYKENGKFLGRSELTEIKK